MKQTCQSSQSMHTSSPSKTRSDRRGGASSSPLHRPEGATWDQQDLFTTRQIVAAELDNIAEAQGQVLPGTTLVSVTSDEGAAEDIGVDIPSDADEVHISSEDVDREDARADEEQE